MTSTNAFLSNCPIARVTQLLGEGWTILILREAFLGTRHFNDFERELGIARNILSARLKKLVEFGLMHRTPCSNDARVIEYRLSEAGQNLFPVMIALAQWSSQWLCECSDALSFVERSTGDVLPTMKVRNQQGRELALHEVIMVAGEDADSLLKERIERGALAAAG